MRHFLFICLTPLIALTSLTNADEFTVEPQPFKIETTLNAIFLPEQSQPVLIKPEKWTDFTVTSLVSQGAVVKKGDRLISIDTRPLDHQIAATEQARQSDALNLAQAKHELAQLEITTPRSLEAYARNENEDAATLKWYTEIGHPIEIEQTNRSVQRAELALAYQAEELKQLMKMYGEDNKTEETEEIILTRTRNSVDRAQFALKATKIEVAHALKTTIPRKLKSHQLTAENSRITNTSAQQTLPRTLAQKRIAVAKAIHDDNEATQNLAKIKADRAMMEITAPADGVVYYGSMEHGKWNPTAAVKVLKVGGKLPANVTLMTFIPAQTPLTLSAFTEAKNLSALTPKATGYAITNLDRYQSFPVTLTHINSHPEADGSFHATLTANIPPTLKVVPGMKATLRVISQTIDKALKIPASYLSRADDGSYTVQVKLADGKTADRNVTVGRSNKEWAVITKGLEKDQVIIK